MLARLAILLFVVFSPVSVFTAEPAPGETPPVYSWSSRLSPATPGAFAPPRSYTANYRITWGGVEAAQADVQVASPSAGSEIRTSLKSSTQGIARTLFKLDAVHLSVVDRSTFRPRFLEQTEHQSTKNSSTRVDFTTEGATRRTRDLNLAESADTNFHKPKRFPYPGLFDMEGVFLYLRSQPLADGDERTVLFMTSGSPYLATIKVVGRGAVHVPAGSFPAIECSLKLEKIGKNGILEPRKGFKSGRAWLSDDANRLLVKAESDLFIGTVQLELDKVAFNTEAR